MKRLLAIASVIVAFCSTVALAQGGVEKTLMDLERQWIKATLASKGEDVAPLLGNDFVMLGVDGTMQTKAVYVANTNKSKWQVSEVSDMTVQVHGDSAIVTGVWTGKGMDATGTSFDGKERFVDTWVKSADGKWQCVASASATVK
jgi:ketosteroid isomerase-like protein